MAETQDGEAQEKEAPESGSPQKELSGNRSATVAEIFPGLVMRDCFRLLACMVVSCMVGALTGCQTFSPDLSPTAFDQPPRIDPITEEEASFARGLARYSQGLIYEQERNFDSALTNFLYSIELDVHNADLSYRIVNGLIRQHRNEEAVDVMEALVKREPDSEKAVSWLALVYRATYQTDKAIETYERLIALTSKSESAYLDYAEFLFRNDRLTEADAVLKKGIKHVKNPSILLTACGQLHEQAMEVFEETDPAYNDHLERAIDAYEQARKGGPDSVELSLQLGDLYVLSGDLEQTLKHFRSVEKMVWNSEEDLAVRRRLALSFIRGKNEEETTASVKQAIQTLQSIPAKPPHHVQIPYYLGELHNKINDTEATLRSFRTACAASKKDHTPFARLSLILVKDSPDKAIDILKQGLERIPEQPLLTETLAYAYLNQHRAVEALPHFAKTKKHLGENASHRFLYLNAKAFYLAGDFAQAISLLSRTMDDNIVWLQVFMQDLLSDERSDLHTVIRFFSTFAKTSPEEPAVFMYLGMLKGYAEEFEEALPQFEYAITLAEAHHRNTQILNEDFYFSFGATHERVGNYEKAETLFYKALAINDKHANAHNYLAYMWAERGINLDKAMEHVQFALEIYPESGAFLDTLGWIHYMNENYEDALREIQKADGLEPGDATINDHLGDILYKLERKEEAIECWKRAFALDSGKELLAKKLSSHGIDPLSIPPNTMEESAEKGTIEQPAKVTIENPDPAPSTDEDATEPEPLGNKPEVTDKHTRRCPLQYNGQSGLQLHRRRAG